MIVKDLVPVHRWGKGKEESSTRVILYIHIAHMFEIQPRGSGFGATAPGSLHCDACPLSGSLGLLQVRDQNRLGGCKYLLSHQWYPWSFWWWSRATGTVLI
jgi:hypothetical protein